MSVLPCLAMSIGLMLSFYSSVLLAKERSGEEIYKDICSTCHENGDLNAPKFGDVDAWKPRLAKGKKALYKSTFEGVGQSMPARNQYESALSDREVYNSVNYMLKFVQ